MIRWIKSKLNLSVAPYKNEDWRSSESLLGAPSWLARGLVKLVPAVAYHLCSICLQHSRNHVRTIKGCPVVSLTCFYGPFRSISAVGSRCSSSKKIRVDVSWMDGWCAALFDATELMEEAERLDGRTRQGRRSWNFGKKTHWSEMVRALGELRIHDVGSAIEKRSRKTSQGPCSTSYAPHSLEEAEQGQLSGQENAFGCSLTRDV